MCLPRILKKNPDLTPGNNSSKQFTDKMKKKQKNLSVRSIKHIGWALSRGTIKSLSTGAHRSKLTVQTQIRLLLKSSLIWAYTVCNSIYMYLLGHYCFVNVKRPIFRPTVSDNLIFYHNVFSLTPLRETSFIDSKDKIKY